MTIFRALPFVAAFCFGLTAQAADTGDAGVPVVVELFTSQGCSSCPPADALIGGMSVDPSILSISWPVDYWNDLGWKDTLSKPEFTARQKAYQDNLDRRFVYTPQVIVNGSLETVGSKEHRVMDAIKQGRTNGLAVSVSYEARADGVELSIGSGHSEKPATLWLVNTLSSHDVEIGAGENNGRVLTYTNVARNVRKLGVWTGQAQTVMIKKSDMEAGGGDGCTILLQEEETGPIIGAVAINHSELQ